MAHYLADEVIGRVSQGFVSSFEKAAIRSVYRMNMDQRFAEVHDQYVDHWIDFSDYNDFEENHGFKVRLSVPELELNVPQDFSEFVAKVERHWQYGYDRAMESFSHPKNDMSFVRNLTPHNSSLKLRKKYNRQRPVEVCDDDLGVDSCRYEYKTILDQKREKKCLEWI